MSVKNNLNDLVNEGVACFDKLEVYIDKLNRSVGDAVQTAVKTNSDKELQQIRYSIELNNHIAGKLRMFLKTQERRMAGLIAGIDKTLKDLNIAPKEVFIQGVSEIKKATKGRALDGIDINFGSPLPEEGLQEPVFLERGNVICPHCEKMNTNFKYGNDCIHCHTKVEVPWKEHATCPHCKKITNTRSIHEDPIGFSLKNGTIACPFCGKNYEYKKYISGPQAYCLKVCAYCDKPYIPDKRNWRKQRTCSDECRDMLFRIENPNYQKKYRNKKK